MSQHELHVTPAGFSELKEWSLLHESEFLSRVYARYGWLRELPPGTTIKVVIAIGVPNSTVYSIIGQMVPLSDQYQEG